MSPDAVSRPATPRSGGCAQRPGLVRRATATVTRRRSVIALTYRKHREITVRKSTGPAVALLLAACAANAPREDLSYQALALSQPPTASAALASSGGDSATRVVPTRVGPATEVVASPSDEAYTAVVCEVRERPGSKIKQEICMTREAYSASREAAKGQLSDLQREQQWRDEVIREAEINGRRPTGPGFGPN